MRNKQKHRTVRKKLWKLTDGKSEISYKCHACQNLRFTIAYMYKTQNFAEWNASTTGFVVKK